jgi:hypothetical protein
LNLSESLFLDLIQPYVYSLDNRQGKATASFKNPVLKPIELNRVSFFPSNPQYRLRSRTKHHPFSRTAFILNATSGTTFKSLCKYEPPRTQLKDLINKTIKVLLAIQKHKHIAIN